VVYWASDISFILAGLTDIKLALLACVVALLTAVATVVAVITETILDEL